jgi:hypothetical protein
MLTDVPSAGMNLCSLGGIVAAAAALALATVAEAGDSGGALRVPELKLRPVFEDPAQIEDKPLSPKPFGAAGSQYLTFGPGIAHNFADTWDYNLRAAYSLFLIDDVEFSLEVNGWYFTESGHDAFGFNPAFVFRWHLINPEQRPWSIFADAGIGVLLASREVPADGTWLDFTPRVGAGFTHRMGDGGGRFQLGARWHHISNARINGDRRNPARDGLMLYAGFMFPF